MDPPLPPAPDWSLLPPELLRHIFSFVPEYSDRKNCSLVCRQWLTEVRRSHGLEWVWFGRAPSLLDHNRRHVSRLPPFPSEEWAIMCRGLSFFSKSVDRLAVGLHGDGSSDVPMLREILERAGRLEALHVACNEPHMSHVLSSLATRLPAHLVLAGIGHIGVLATTFQLTRLVLLRSSSVSSLATISLLPRIRALSISDCASLRDLDSLFASRAHSARIEENLTSLEVVNFGEMQSIEAIGRLRNLRELVLGDLQQVSSLSPLGFCEGLTRLEVSRSGPLDLRIPPLAALRKVVLRGVLLQDYDFLTASHETLETVDISDTRHDRFLPMPEFPRLRSFVSPVPLGGPDFSSASRRLQRVKFELAPHESDLSFLAEFNQIRRLCVKDCVFAADVSFLYLLAPSLRHLSLTHMAVLMDYSPISRCTGLTHLDLTGGQGVHSLAEFTPLVQLCELVLDQCRGLWDIEPLGRDSDDAYKRLTRVSFSKCHSLTTISPIVRAGSLRSLDVSYCDGLTEAWDLISCPFLEEVNTTGCEFADFPELAGFFSGGAWRECLMVERAEAGLVLGV